MIQHTSRNTALLHQSKRVTPWGEQRLTFPCQGNDSEASQPQPQSSGKWASPKNDNYWPVLTLVLVSNLWLFPWVQNPESWEINIRNGIRPMILPETRKNRSHPEGNTWIIGFPLLNSTIQNYKLHEGKYSIGNRILKCLVINKIRHSRLEIL